MIFIFSFFVLFSSIQVDTLCLYVFHIKRYFSLLCIAWYCTARGASCSYIVSFYFVFFCILCMHNVFFGVFYILLFVLHQAGVAEELPVLVFVLLYSFVF